MKKQYAIDMCSGALAPKILAFALPLMAATVLQLTFNLADVIVVGKFAGDLAQAAVTSTTSLINLLLSIFFGLSGGTNVVVARALGAGKPDRAKDVVHTCVLLGAVCGIALGAAGILAAPALLTVMKSPANVIGLSTIYLRIYFLGIPATVVYNFASAILRANGDTRRPLYFLSLAGVINVVLNLVFVIGFHLDVAGVAIATAVSQWVSALLAVRCLMGEDGPLHLDLRGLYIKWDALGEIARIGIPAGLQSSLFSLSNVVIQSSINSLGETVMAGSGAASTIEHICYQVGTAFFHAATSFVSQNYGARRLDRADRSFLWCEAYTIVCGLLMAAVTIPLGPTLLRLFTDSPEVVAQGMVRMRYVITLVCLGGAMDVCTATLRGFGWSVIPMFVTLTGVCGFRLVWMSTVFRAAPTPENIYIAYPISWAVTAGAHLCTLFVARRRAKRAFAAQESAQE